MVPMRRLFRFAIAGVLVLGGPALVSVRAEKADKKAPDETKAREKIAKIWLDLGTYLVDRGYKAPANDALREAREVEPDAPELKKLEDRVAAVADGGAPDAEAAKRTEKAAKDAAKAWERLADAYDSADPRHVQYVMKAASLDESTSRVQRLGDAAKKTSIVVRGPKHPMTAWLSLPGAWKPGKRFPVLVTVEGAGANFAGNHSGFKSGRGSRDLIVLSPFALSSTNQLVPEKYPHYGKEILEANEAQGTRIDWDVEGLLSLLDLLKERFGADEKVAITGFSGGGLLCYAFTFRHPDRVRLCAPACANFHAGLPAGAPEVADGGPRVRISTGEKDEHREHVFGQRPGIEGQTDQAAEAFERLGYKDVKRVLLPGVGHSSCVAEVWKAVDEALETGR
jgi:poly(3-hydroxybutyrate) depolymerase